MAMASFSVLSVIDLAAMISSVRNVIVYCLRFDCYSVALVGRLLAGNLGAREAHNREWLRRRESSVAINLGFAQKSHFGNQDATASPNRNGGGRRSAQRKASSRKKLIVHWATRPMTCSTHLGPSQRTCLETDEKLICKSWRGTYEEQFGGASGTWNQSAESRRTPIQRKGEGGDERAKPGGRKVCAHANAGGCEDHFPPHRDRRRGPSLGRTGGKVRARARNPQKNRAQLFTIWRTCLIDAVGGKVESGQTSGPVNGAIETLALRYP